MSNETNNFIEIEDQLPQNIDINKLKELLKNFKEGKISNVYEVFNIDKNQEISQEEKEIIEKLKTIENIISFLEYIINEIEKNQNGSKNQEQETKNEQGLLNISETLKNKDISQLSKEEAILVLNYLGENYQRFNDLSNIQEEFLEKNGHTINSVNKLQSKEEVLRVQKELITKILGLGNNFNLTNGFNDTYITGQNSNKGYYIEKIENFEKNSKSIMTFSGKGSDGILLGSYLLYLESKGKLDQTNLNKVFNEQLINLLKFVQSEDKDYIKKMVGYNESASIKLEKALQISNQDRETIIKTIDLKGIKEIFVDEYFLKYPSLIPYIEEDSQRLNKIINKLDNSNFIKYPNLLKHIKDFSKLKELLNYCNDNKQKAEFKYLSTEIQKECLLQIDVKELENTFNIIDSDFLDLDKQFLENNLETLLLKFKNNPTHLEYIIFTFIGKSINKELIINTLQKNNINYEGSQKINEALLTSKISHNEFKQLLQKVLSAKDYSDEYVEENEIVTLYITDNIDKTSEVGDDVQKALSQMIEKGNFGRNGRLVYLIQYIDSLDSYEKLLSKNPWIIKFVPEKYKGNEKILESILDPKNTAYDYKIKLECTQYLDLSNINILLGIFGYMKTNGLPNGESYSKEEFTNYLQTNGIIGVSILKAFNNTKNIDINNKYSSDYNQLLEIVKASEDLMQKDNLKLLYDLQNGREIFEKGLQDNEKKESEEKFLNYINGKEFGKNLQQILGEGENTKAINTCKEIINKNLKNGINQKSIQSLYNELVNSKNIPEEKIGEILSLINNELRNFNKSEIKRNSKEIDVTMLNKDIIKTVDKKEIVDEEALSKKYKELIKEKKKTGEKLDKAEKQKIIEETIKLCTNENANEETNEKLRNILKLVDTDYLLNLYQNNINATVEYFKSGSPLSFEEYAKENNIKLNTLENNINNNENQEYGSIGYITTNEYQYEKGSSSVHLGDKNIPLSKQEQKLIGNNPDILKQVIDFYKLLENIGLSKLWNIKEKIFTGISNVYGIGFKLDGDYLNINEIKVFLNSILKSTGQDTISQGFSLANFISKFELINKTQIISGNEKEVNLYGETFLESEFLKNFYPKGESIFKNNEFEKSLTA